MDSMVYGSQDKQKQNVNLDKDMASTKPACIIERVNESDAEELLSIYEPYVKNTAVSFECEVPSVEEFRKRIKDISSKYPYFKAIVDGQIVGYTYANSFKGRRAYDYSVETTIYLRAGVKRQGIGRVLYERLEEALKAMGILNMNACIASPEAEDEFLTRDSEKFHSSMGFKLVGHFHKCGYKFERFYDMIWMEKLIGEHVSGLRDVSFGEW